MKGLAVARFHFIEDPKLSNDWGPPHRGQKEAERKYPSDVIKQTDLSSELSKSNKEALAKELKLTLEQLREISTEGLVKNWPIPKW